MGSKSNSKIIMENAKVPITPGYHGDNQDPEYLKYEAVGNVGFPLLIKGTRIRIGTHHYKRGIISHLSIIQYL